MLGIDSDKKSKSVFPLAAYTLGISSFDEMKLKIEEAKNFGFQFFKIKLNGENDEEVISNFKKLSDDSYAVDINGGWKNADEAMRKINWLAKHECLFVEQPLPKNSLDEMKLLKEKSALPLYADESCQRLIDLKKLKECFDGVNIKLMKCGGITEAHQMILKARELGLKVLIGCMSESSVGCTAAAHLTPLVDYADLDGPYLISNDPFEGMSLEFGTIQVNQLIQKVTL